MTELGQVGAGGRALYDPPQRAESLGLVRRLTLTAPESLARGTLEGVTNAPIVVHRPVLSGGQRVTVHSSGRDEFLNTAYAPHSHPMNGLRPVLVSSVA